MIGGLLLITAALLLTGYNLWDEQRAAASAGVILEQIFPVLQTNTGTSVMEERL